jgi:hypothetical protein
VGNPYKYPYEINAIRRDLPDAITETTARSGTPSFSAISAVLIIFTKCKVKINLSSSGRVVISSAIVLPLPSDAIS